MEDKYLEGELGKFDTSKELVGKVISAFSRGQNPVQFSMDHSRVQRPKSRAQGELAMILGGMVALFWFSDRHSNSLWHLALKCDS